MLTNEMGGLTVDNRLITTTDNCYRPSGRYLSIVSLMLPYSLDLTSQSLCRLLRLSRSLDLSFLSRDLCRDCYTFLREGGDIDLSCLVSRELSIEIAIDDSEVYGTYLREIVGSVGLSICYSDEKYNSCTPRTC
jgi:hypothetical protein